MNTPLSSLDLLESSAIWASLLWLRQLLLFIGYVQVLDVFLLT